MDISILLEQNESESLDFKQKFHARSIELLHDILCLANSYAEGDRYLVFGVTDAKVIVGIQNDQNRKTNAMIQDLLRTSKCSRIPTVRLRTYPNYNGHALAVLEIKNRPDKPFFLLADKQDGRDRIRAGVVYTRIGDTNIPLGESAPEDHIELMWRERFGLGLDPLARLSKLIKERDKWIKIVGNTTSFRYHQDFPEFTIREGEIINSRFVEPWTMKFPDPSAQSYYIDAHYHSTVLRKMVFVSCDGGRYQVPLPRMDATGTKRILDLGSLEYKVAMLFHQYFPLVETLSGRGVEIVGDDDSA